jgi:hypothetical protein
VQFGGIMPAGRIMPDGYDLALVESRINPAFIVHDHLTYSADGDSIFEPFGASVSGLAGFPRARINPQSATATAALAR